MFEYEDEISATIITFRQESANAFNDLMDKFDNLIKFIGDDVDTNDNFEKSEVELDTLIDESEKNLSKEKKSG